MSETKPTKIWGLTLGQWGKGLGFGVDVASTAYGIYTDYQARQEEAKDREYRRKMDKKQDSWNYRVGQIRDGIGIMDVGTRFLKNAFGGYNNQIDETPKSYDQLKVVQAQRYPWAYRATIPMNMPPYVPKTHFYEDAMRYRQSYNSDNNRNKPPTSQTPEGTYRYTYHKDGSYDLIYTKGTGKNKQVITYHYNKYSQLEKTTSSGPVNPAPAQQPAALAGAQPAAANAANSAVREEAVRQEPALNNPIPSPQQQINTGVILTGPSSSSGIQPVITADTVYLTGEARERKQFFEELNRRLKIIPGETEGKTPEEIIVYCRDGLKECERCLDQIKQQKKSYQNKYFSRLNQVSNINDEQARNLRDWLNDWEEAEKNVALRRNYYRDLLKKVDASSSSKPKTPAPPPKIAAPTPVRPKVPTPPPPTPTPPPRTLSRNQTIVVTEAPKSEKKNKTKITLTPKLTEEYFKRMEESMDPETRDLTGMTRQEKVDYFNKELHKVDRNWEKLQNQEKQFLEDRARLLSNGIPNTDSAYTDIEDSLNIIDDLRHILTFRRMRFQSLLNQLPAE